MGQYCRGIIAEVLGYPMKPRDVGTSCDAVPLTVVVDAKDVYDKSTSDTPSFGSQKSLAFTVAWLCNLLGRPNTSIRWTATENMISDTLTKDMDGEHLRRVIKKGRWCARYSPLFVKQTSKEKPSKATLADPDALLGRPLAADDPMLSRLLNLSDSPGWHQREGIPIHVAKGARSFRSPEPRFDSEEFDIRSSYGRLDFPDGRSEWRELEKNVKYSHLRGGRHGLTG